MMNVNAATLVRLLDAKQACTALAKQVMADLAIEQDPRWLVKHHPDPLLGHVLYQVLDKQARDYVTGLNDEHEIGTSNARELHAKIMQEMIR